MRLDSVDVLIVGAGAAGLSAAIAAFDAGARVLLMAKANTGQTASYQTQGGIAAALNHAGDGDTWEQHAEDTMLSGKGLSDREPVEILCREAIDRVLELDRWGAAFDHDAEGKIRQRPYGGHRKVRACFAGDQTGVPLMATLREQVQARGIPFRNDCIVIDLLREEEACVGVLAWNEETQIMERMEAPAVVIATGGIGQAYAVTSNPPPATGDGLAWAQAFGVELRDMEFIQFHPTGLYPTGHLISEACRAEGGYLINGEGRRFMFDYDARGELATRDIVARAIFSEIKAGRGLEDKPYVGLDLRHLGEEMIQTKLPLAQKTAQAEAGVDVLKEMIPVAPTQHYCMGGIPTTVDGAVLRPGRRAVPGLFAAGESACLSVHGANRLGCNSFVECLVFGQRAGRQAALTAQETFVPAPSSVSPQIRVFAGSAQEISLLRQELRSTMTAACGVEREATLMQAAEAKLHTEIGTRFHLVEAQALTEEERLAMREQTELYSLYVTAMAILQAAQRRKDSVGAHFRTDAPSR